MSSSDGFSKEEVERIAKWEFKGLTDAAQLMQKRPAGSKFVGRWDWHFWMFLVTTCLPCFGIYCFAMWMRSSLWEAYRQQEASGQLKTTKNNPQEQLSALQEEIKKLKMMMWMSGVDAPKLSPESWRRLYEKSAADKDKEGHQEAKKEQKRESFSERMWGFVTPWLPFYVEPFRPMKDGKPVNVDIAALRNVHRRSDT